MDPVKLRPHQQRFPLGIGVDTDAGPTKIDPQRAERTQIDFADVEPTLPPDPPPARADDHIERYELGAELGKGTFGRVYAARDRKLGRQVALKLLHPDRAMDVDIRRRFVQEAHAAACIAHAGIVTIFDVGESHHGALYIAMELLAGETLHARVTRGPLAAALASELGRQVASAVGAAHAAGVIHRDLKPENIFLVPDAATAIRERAIVLDFGLAKPARPAVQTQVATILGTPTYMSPEQCRGTTGVDHRTDIYSLGCILYQLVTGAPPFTGTLREIITSHQTATPPRISADPAYADLVAQMLAKRPEDRPQTMATVEAALVPRDAAVAPVRPSRRRWFGLF